MTIATDNRLAFAPTESQRMQIERLFVMLWANYHDEGTTSFAELARECDNECIPMWVQNNVSAMADCRQVYYMNSKHRIIDAACNLDWRPHVRS
jgi:hypothetical protein